MGLELEGTVPQNADLRHFGVPMRPPTFEGVPWPTDLPAALLDADQRARWVRAAVVHASFAGDVITACTAMLAAEAPEARSVAIQVGRALLARALTTPLAAAILADDPAFAATPDPGRPGWTLAQSALALVAEVASPGHREARAALRHALGRPDLMALAWRVVGGEDADAVLPHLPELLRTHPELADEVGTRFALLFTDRCEEAAQAAAGLPEATRRALGAALEKHLLRIHAVKRWVACRRALFGL